MDKISIIVPVFNEEVTIPIFYKEIINVLSSIKNISYEILFVDDGSNDKTLEIIKKLNKKNKNIRCISFSRNFGKESAIYAGLSYAKGDYVTVMDVDLQDQPSLLPEMYKYVKNGYDSVATRRVNRKGEPPIRSFFARQFYKIINKMSKVEMVDGARDFRLMNRKFVDSVLSIKEYNRYSKGIFSFVGFKTKWLEFENKKRVAGETKWSFIKLFKYGVQGITSFSTAPLSLASYLGVIICLISFIWIIVIVVKTLLFGDPVKGYPSMACILLFVSGIQLLCLGIIGEYLSKTYLEVKNRPIYIISEKSE